MPKGDVRLYGGRALYDPDALLILHEDAGDEFTNAFLVAHEIGHVEFGGETEPSATSDVDPFRSSEAVPIGIDRVADYSQRQRREVQMDLFAREFLLPRPWVRKLHLEDGASAAAVASKLGAPHAVVSQQLLDALLLPRVEIPREKSPREAAEAGPGSSRDARGDTLPSRSRAGYGKNADARRQGRLSCSARASIPGRSWS